MNSNKEFNVRTFPRVLKVIILKHVQVQQLSIKNALLISHPKHEPTTSLSKGQLYCSARISYHKL